MSGRGELKTGRVAVVGVDGFSPVLMDRFVSQGELPAIGALVRRGVRVPLVSTLPATTPVAWATAATGAPPSVTGIEGFLVHCPGDRLDQRVSGCYSYRCRAASVWDAATDAGKRSYVVKFPLSYPSLSPSFRLDGAAGWGGLKCFHEAASTSVASTSPAGRQAAISPYPTAWLSERRRGARRVLWRGLYRLPSLWGGPEIELHLALVAAKGGGTMVEIADAPDRRRVLASLRAGEWSSPLTVRARGRRAVADCCFRVKVLSCAAAPLDLKLFHTALHERTGHSDPDETWRKYVEEVGPIEEQTEPSLVFNAGLDLPTQMEIFRLNSEWLQTISTELLAREPWDLFMVHIHIVDWAHHLLHGGIDPRHPDYDAATAPEYNRLILDVYRMADELVGAVARAIGPEDNLVVLGDHGQDLQHTTLRTNEWLASRGWLRWAGEGEGVDWSATSAYATGNYIHLNITGREPDGVLAAAAAERTKEEIVAQLLDLTDPAGGSRPVLIAGDKREFEFLGADGAGVGDVVFCLRSGYQATNDRGPIFSPTRLLREFTSGHDHFWPLDPRIHTRLFAAGPSFRRGYDHRRLAHLVDVAPTLCAALGIEPPADCRGHSIRELFADGAADLARSAYQAGGVSLGI